MITRLQPAPHHDASGGTLTGHALITTITGQGGSYLAELLRRSG
jgi:hypothetical protein